MEEWKSNKYRCKDCNTIMRNDEDLVYRLRKRAMIRRQILTRKSVQNGEPDKISDLLEEAADRIEDLEDRLSYLQESYNYHLDNL